MAIGVDVGAFTGSDFKGDEAIKKIMEAESKNKIPLDNQMFNLKMQKQAWQGLRQKLSELSNAAHDIYSPAYSSFRKMKAQSSQPNLVDISTTGIDPNTLTPGSYSIIPKQMAEPDHFKSDMQDPNQKLPGSQFNVVYQGKTYPVNFTGGSLQDLSQEISQVGDFLNSRYVDFGSNGYLDISSKDPGSKSGISFSGNTDLLKNIGLIMDAIPTYYDLKITEPIGLQGNKEIPDLLFNNELVLQSKDAVKKQLAKIQTVSDQAQVWIYLTTQHDQINQNKPKIPAPAQNDNVIPGFIDKVWVGDTTLLGEPLITSLTSSSAENDSEQQNTTPTPPIEKTPYPLSLTFVYANGTKKIMTTYVQNTGKTEIIKGFLSAGELKEIDMVNNSSLELHISKAEIIELNKGKSDHKNSVTKAQNAIVNYQGIDQERETNTISDIVPGTLTLKGESGNPIDLTIGFDTDAILDQIKNWVIAYNNTMDFIKNVSHASPSFFEDLRRNQKKEISVAREKYEKMSDEEKVKLAQDGKLFDGMLNGDSAIDMLKSKLKSFTIKPYKTDLKEKLTFLSQLGIAVPNGSQMLNMSDTERENYNAGYLDFTQEGQKQFLDQLNSNFGAVKQFFFQRTNHSPSYNDGMLIDYTNLLQAYLSRYSGKLPGFFTSKDNLLSSQISGQQKKLDDADDKMKKDENKLRTDFSKVYEAQSKAKDLGNRFAHFGDK